MTDIPDPLIPNNLVHIIRLYDVEGVDQKALQKAIGIALGVPQAFADEIPDPLVPGNRMRIAALIDAEEDRERLIPLYAAHEVAVHQRWEETNPDNPSKPVPSKSFSGFIENKEY